MSGATEINRALEQEAPGLFASLSDLGRRAFFPPDIPFQAQQARGKTFNATIGQITDGAGSILALEAVERALDAMAPADRNRGLLYSPIEGLPELREAWRSWQLPRDFDGTPPATGLPVVTCGLTHGLALAADLFAGPGRKIFVPAPFWGNYRQIFGLRTGAEIVPVAAFSARRWQPRALAEAIEREADDQPAVVVLNVPSNPTGYSPTVGERRALVDSLIDASARRPVVVICDDAYAGLVYDDEIPADSLFWQLADQTETLIPIRVAGATKEFVFFGGRVGFITPPLAAGSASAAALENKLKGLIRAGIGSPPALSQVILLRALENPARREQIDAVIAVLANRYRALRSELAAAEREEGLFRTLPFNSGAFALTELEDDLDPDDLRRRLLDQEDVGLVSIRPSYLRIAFCSLAAEAVPELVARVCRGIREARRSVASGARE